MAEMNNPQTTYAPATRVVHAHQVPHSHQPTGIRKFFAFLGWVFSGFGLVGMFRKKGQLSQGEEVIVYAVHKSFFLWPVILVGFFGGWLVSHHLRHANATTPSTLPHVAGWIYIWVMLYTFVVMLFDVGTLNFLIWGLN